MLELAVAFWMLTHEHNDPNYDWYTQQQNQRHGSCCNNNDWYNPVDWRRTPNGYQVFVKERWIDIPDWAVLKGPSPTGQSVVWYSMPRGDIDLITIYCFVPGAEG